MNTPQKAFYTVLEAAVTANVSHTKIRQWIKEQKNPDGSISAGMLQAEGVGVGRLFGMIRINKADFDAWLARCQGRTGNHSTTASLPSAPEGTAHGYMQHEPMSL